MEELEEGTYSILEPRAGLRDERDREVDIGEVDLAVVPGVAFDREGGRMGHGKGYYDRLLGRARPDTPLVGLAFECQLFAEIPMDENDVPMDKIITEREVYRGRGRISEKKP
jgi:5-formyltetrahydrofolate cyclo-ligase